MRVVFVTALALSGALQREFDELQTRLYRENGLAGARALPAMIPLALFEDPAGGQIPEGFEQLLPRGPARLPELRPAGYVARHGALYLLYSPETELSKLAREAVAAGGESGLSPSEQPFPPAPGVLIAVGPPELLVSLEPRLPPPPAAPIRQAWWQALRVTVHDDPVAAKRSVPWWYAVEYEVLAERRIAKASRTG